MRSYINFQVRDGYNWGTSQNGLYELGPGGAFAPPVPAPEMTGENLVPVNDILDVQIVPLDAKSIEWAILLNLVGNKTCTVQLSFDPTGAGGPWLAASDHDCLEKVREGVYEAMKSATPTEPGQVVITEEMASCTAPGNPQPYYIRSFYVY